MKRNWYKIMIACWLLSPALTTVAQKATWIWYPGDFEIALGNKMQNRRTERGTFLPPFWKLDNHYVLMNFQKKCTLATSEEAAVWVEGEYNLKIDGKAIEGTPHHLIIPAGKHTINIKVFNQLNVPAIYVKGNTIVSDTSWLVTYEDKEWIDETGKASDQSGTTWLNAGHWNFNDPSSLPSKFKLPVTPQSAVTTTKNNSSLLMDFGKETFGFIKLHGLKGNGRLSLYYGESKEEALSPATCETLDRLDINLTGKTDSVMKLSKAFRYVNVQYDPGIQMDSVSMLYEYSDVKERGSFKCNDEEINQIYEIAKYTFRLNTREFFIDGIKRDRWVWSGDACQSYLMNYYSWFDNGTVSRTLLELRGKDPVTAHINTIMDYTFYWFLGIYDYYLYTGDQTMIRQFYPRMQSLMEYCLGRRDKDGLLQGLAGDWIFIDWAAGLSKKGQVSFEQLLFCRSLETMALCATIAGDQPGAGKYQQLAAGLKKKLFQYYWNAGKQALVHSRIDGAPTGNITRYANMFAIFFNYFTESQKQAVKKSVLLNDSIQKITTPYMHFYELEALCTMGEQAHVLKEIKDYWGGMLKLGATTFWEEYNPDKKGAEHYSMYGREFGKSLCHAWGASPIYLLGKYFLGVKPTAPGYEQYSVEPRLGGLQWMEGKVPTPSGEIEVYCNSKQIKVKSPIGTGTLRFSSSTKPVCKEGAITVKENNQYEMILQKDILYTISWSAMNN